MLFHVRMDVRLPHDLPQEKADSLKQVERERARELQRQGKWRHLWRVAGRYANISVFDVETPEQMTRALTEIERSLLTIDGQSSR